jgi:hypothetical protein
MGFWVRLPVEMRCIMDQGAYMRLDLDASFPLALNVARKGLEESASAGSMNTAVLIRPENIHVLG